MLDWTKEVDGSQASRKEPGCALEGGYEGLCLILSLDSLSQALFRAGRGVLLYVSSEFEFVIHCGALGSIRDFTPYLNLVHTISCLRHATDSDEISPSY